MIGKDFPGRGKVAVLKTSPQTVLEDYARLMRLAGYEQVLPKHKETILHVHLAWQTWYPACSTTPWQLEGTIRALQADKYRNLIAVHHRAESVDAYIGERNNKHKDIIDAYGVRNVHLYEPYVKWVRYEPKSPLLILDKVFPEGIFIPELFMGRNMIQLPTVKTHVFTVIAGAMENAFEGLLNEGRHKAYTAIHEALVDILTIQKEIHTGLFAVMDGTFAGDGAGPWAMRWHEKDIILASADAVAIDAISAYIQGFDPMSIPFIRIAHEMGLGVGDPKDIEVVGCDISGEHWGFRAEDTLASRWQKAVYHGALGLSESTLWRTPLMSWSQCASALYHKLYWYPVVGRRRVKEALETKWGHHFAVYGDGRVVLPSLEPRTTAIAAGSLLALMLLLIGAVRRVTRRKE